jgi:hypothetical protein
MSDADETETRAETTAGTDSLDEAIVDALRSAERSPLPATEVAKRVDHSYEETRARLVELADAGDVERRKLEHGTWWRVPGREAEPSEADVEAARESGRLVASGVDDDEAFEDEHPAGPPPFEREDLWSGVEVHVEFDRRALAAVVFIGLLVLAVRWRRR